jgi:hypothetical protein
MAKIIIKNGPKDINQMAKLIVEISTRQIDVPANGIVDARESKK